MYKGKKEMRRQVAALLRDVHTLTTSFEDLPKRTIPLIKLRYYSNTPLDYEPPGFKMADSLYKFDHKPNDYYLGSFQSKILSFELSRYERSFANEILVYEGEAVEVKLCQPNHQRALNDVNDLLRVDGLLEQRDSETETNDGSSGTVKPKQTMASASSVRPATIFEAPSGLQRSTSGGRDKFHSSSDDAEEVVAGNLLICETKHADATTIGDSAWKARQQDSRVTMENMSRRLQLHAKGSTQKRGATIDTSSDKASFDSIDALGTLISQYISRMSFNFGYALETSANTIGTGVSRERNDGQGASRVAEGGASQKCIHSSSASVVLSSCSSLMSSECMKGDLMSEQRPCKKRKVSRMNRPRFRFFADFFDDFIAGIVVDCLFADLWLLIGVNVVDVLAKIMADG
uniref:HORMA domain-containing protein n=1 Tax=Ascaris lumbricoides TaxID=6252 RepID=A0A0M3IKR4_ASCLU